jgi:hypothetical protein
MNKHGDWKPFPEAYFFLTIPSIDKGYEMNQQLKV